MRHDDLEPIQSSEEVAELVVNLDDVTGQVVGDAVNALLDAGALDVWTIPIAMKKQRPGVMLSVLCLPDQRDEFVTMIHDLTGSFGVRFRTWNRSVLRRRHVVVETRLGPIRLKVGEKPGGGLASVQPEFADVKKAALAHGVTVREAMRVGQAAAEAWERTQGKN